MAVTIPPRFEDALALEDGSQGRSLKEMFSFQNDKVENLYSYDCNSKQFQLSFQERGVAYGDTESSDHLVKVVLELAGAADFQLNFSTEPVTVWGLNFAGTVRVLRNGSEERVIYLPGTRTYDPAGISGDPHASERIGPSCSRTQAAVSLAQLVAALKGADMGMLIQLQEKLRPMIARYHGRELLFDWMLLQIKQAIFEDRGVTPYPEYLKEQIRKGKLVLSEKRQHTRLYLESYNKGVPWPPVQYFRKVAAKDNVASLLSKDDLEKFNLITVQ